MPLFIVEPIAPEVAGVAGTTLVGAVAALWRQHLKDVASRDLMVTTLRDMTEAMRALSDRIDGLGA